MSNFLVWPESSQQFVVVSAKSYREAKKAVK